MVLIRVSAAQTLLRSVCAIMEATEAFGANGSVLSCDVHGSKIVIIRSAVLLRCWPRHRLVHECVLRAMCFAQEWACKATGCSVTVDIVPLAMETCIGQQTQALGPLRKVMQTGTSHAYPSHDMRISTSSSLPPLFGSLGNQSP